MRVRAFGKALFTAGIFLIVAGIAYLSFRFPVVGCASGPYPLCVVGPNLFFEFLGLVVAVVGLLLYFVGKSKEVIPPAPATSRVPNRVGLLTGWRQKRED